MNSQNRRWLKTAAATVGAAALTLGGVAMPAMAVEAAPEAKPLNVQKDKYALAAANVGASAAALKQLEAQGFAQVTKGGAVYQIDPSVPAVSAETTTDEGAPISGSPAAGSRPGAPVTIYLDFDGETLKNEHWSEGQGQDSITFAPAAIADAAFQAEVWAIVAEDYAPFNVNVTTTRPSDDALYKTSVDDNVYGSHVIVTDSYSETLAVAAGSGGIAALSGAGSEYYTGALVFTTGVGGGNPAMASAKSVAEGASHEAGHNFGLLHDGIGNETYFHPLDGLWAPIMGAGYETPISQWSAGAYENATSTDLRTGEVVANTQDDLATITDRSAGGAWFLGAYYQDGTEYDQNSICVFPGEGDPQDPQPGDKFYVPNPDGTCDRDEPVDLRFTYVDRANYAADDHGDDAANATKLDNADGTFAQAGVIGSTNDVDAFAVTTDGGDVTAKVDVANVGANLNAKLTLTDAKGNVVAENSGTPKRVSAAEATGLGAEVSASGLAAGTYYLTVDGVAFGDGSGADPDSGVNGFVQYGSLGNYTVSGKAQPKTEKPDPTIEAPAITAPKDGATTEDTTPTISGTGVAGATVTVTIGDEKVTTKVAADGTWTVDFTKLAEGDHTVTAVQALNGVTSKNSNSVSFTVKVKETPKPELAAPVITSPENGSTTTDTTPTISGTGVAGATVTISINDAHVTTTVAEDGTWTAEFERLVAGEFTVTAVQKLDGKTSEKSESVTFTVKVKDTPKPTVEAPVITSPENGSTTEDTTPTVSGTGIPGATVVITTTNDLRVTTTVDKDGNWKAELPKLAEGEYTIIANQTVKGQISPRSEAVTFTVKVKTDDGNNNNENENENNENENNNNENENNNNEKKDETPVAETGLNSSFAGLAAFGGGLLLVGAAVTFVGSQRRKSLRGE